MKVAKCRVQVNPEVVNKTQDISDYIRKNHWDEFSFESVFGPWANMKALVGITRHIVDDDKLDIFFILNDEYAESFLLYFSTLEKLKNYYIGTGIELIEYDAEIMSLFDEQTHTNIWTQHTYT
jgi:hypothetical protein